jgi:hypothetical protein
MAGEIILSVAYGIDVQPQGDPFVEAAENMLGAMAFSSTKEASLFDLIPWRSYPSRFLITDYILLIYHLLAVIHMPEWLPVARLKREARSWLRIVENAQRAPYEKVKRELVSSPDASRLL